MKELAQLIPHRGKVAVLAGNPNAPNLRRRVEGVMSEAAHHPGLTDAGAVLHTSRHRRTRPPPSCAPRRRTRTSPGWAMVGGWPLYTQTLLHNGVGTPKLMVPGLVPVIVSINAIPPQLVYVEKGLAPVLLAQPTYLWGEVGVRHDRRQVLLRKSAVPERIPMELVRVTRDNLGAWVRQLRAWGFVDAPEEYLERHTETTPRGYDQPGQKPNTAPSTKAAPR